MDEEDMTQPERVWWALSRVNVATCAHAFVDGRGRRVDMGRIAAPSRLLLAARGCHGLASPERVVVVHKTSRLEWEKRRRVAPELINEVCVCVHTVGGPTCSVPPPLLQQSVSSPDYQLLLHRHEVHSKSLDEIQTYLA